MSLLHKLGKLLFIRNCIWFVSKSALKTKQQNINNNRIYINKFENRITFEIKTEYYPEILTPIAIKLLGSTENKVTRDRKNSENLVK